MRAAAGLDDADRPLESRVVEYELQQHHVVGKMRDPVLGEAGGAEELRDLLGHHHADALAHATLQQGVDALTEAEFLDARGPQVAETVDDDSLRTRALDLVQEVVHPLIEVETIKALMISFRTAPLPILIASYQGKRGHPVLFSSQVYGEILAAPLDQGAKVVVRKDPTRVREIPLEDLGILADIDTPEDYARYVGLKK